ncbi:hypothetical protein [Terrabacter sp. BE26]|uniref:hypothetical protein n=1 Tax=Terrabacter sp. BE26 TaxID=2898152 RepID=UPI0035BE131F
MSKRTLATVVAGLAAMPTLLMLAAAPAAAATGGSVQVSNTETVQAYLDATGKVDVARVYEQVAMKGHGTVELANPVETQNLRNLDSFSGFDVKDGAMVGRFDVDGEQRLRSVSDFTRKLPLEVVATYTLDGKPIAPEDVLGRSGHLEVRYTVKNVTGLPKVVTFDDGTGRSSSVTQSVVIPMVGSLATTLPDTFTNVASKEAALAGDGHGGTKLTFTMTLFGPIGTPMATFGYTADIVEGTLPKATVAALPVSPLDSPSFKGGAASYKSGATTGGTLAAGATEIDANLLKLRDGAGTLLAGLIQLRDGAKKLDAGLGAQALPGSRELASGAGQLKDGTAKLRSGAATAKDGSSQVAGGATQLADGADQVDAGAEKLSGGATQVDAGAGRLAQGAGLLNTGAGLLSDGLVEAGSKAPALLTGLKQVAGGLERVDKGLATMSSTVGGPDVARLRGGLAAMLAGLGGTTDGSSLIGGVDQLRLQLKAAGPGIDKMEAGVYGTKGESAYEQLGCAVKVVNDLRLGAAAGADPCYAATGGIRPPLAPTADPYHQAVLAELAKELGAGRARLADPANTSPELDAPLPDDATLQQGLAYLRGRLLERAVPGLSKIECGLSAASLPSCDPTRPGLKEALAGVGDQPGIIAGFDALTNGVIKNIGGDADELKDGTLRGGVHALQGGVDQLAAGGMDLLDGLGQLSDGAAQLNDGTKALASGSAQLKAGTGQLAKGAKDLGEGTSKLAKGSGDLATGAGQLDTGVGRLAAGAGQLDDGAGKLRTGAGQLADGLGDAASGASRISAGLTDAAAGAPRLRDGAQQLSDDGTKKLVAAGKATAADYGEKYALIEVGAQRAKAEGMAYGAPTGAEGATAYSFELAGVDGQGSANLGRAAAAAGVFGLAGGSVLLRRRFL